MRALRPVMGGASPGGIDGASLKGWQRNNLIEFDVLKRNCSVAEIKEPLNYRGKRDYT
jgi:hypothetical protein